MRHFLNPQVVILDTMKPWIAALCALALVGCGERSGGGGMPLPPQKESKASPASPLAKESTPGATEDSAVTAPPATEPAKTEEQTPPAPPTSDPAPTAPPAPGTTAPTYTDKPVSAPKPDGQVYTLRYNIPAGTTANYKQDISMSINSPLSGPGKPMEISSTTDQTLKILKASPKDFTVRTDVTNVQVQGDRSQPGMSQLAQGIQATKGTTYNATFSKVGKVTSGGGKDKFSGRDIASMAYGFGTGFQGLTFPEKPVKLGDTWTSELDFNEVVGSLGQGMGGVASMDKLPVTTKLLAVTTQGGRKFADLEIVMSGKPKLNAKGGQSGGGFKMDMSIQGRHLVRIDLATGLAESIEGTTESSVSMSMGPKAKPIQMSQLMKFTSRRMPGK